MHTKELLLSAAVFLLLAFWVLFVLPWELYALRILPPEAWRLGP